MFSDQCSHGDGMCTCHDEALLNFLTEFRSAGSGGLQLADAAVVADERPIGSVSTISEPPPEEIPVIRLTGARPEGLKWDAPAAAFGPRTERRQVNHQPEPEEPAVLPPPPKPPELVVVSRPSAPAWYEADHSRSAPRGGAARRVVAVVLLFVLAAGAGYYYVHKQPVRPIEARSLTQIVKTTVAAARHAGSAHVAGTFTQHGLTLHASIDISPKGGTEVVVIGRDRMEVVVAGGYGYVRATYGALTRWMGVPAPTAARYQNKWLKMAATSRGTLGFTGPAMIKEVLSLENPQQYHGRLVAGDNLLVQGTVPGTRDRASLYVSRKSPFYPTRIVFADAQKGTVQFSKWGEPVKLAPPYQSIPVSLS